MVSVCLGVGYPLVMFSFTAGTVSRSRSGQLGRMLLHMIRIGWQLFRWEFRRCIGPSSALCRNCYIQRRVYYPPASNERAILVRWAMLMAVSTKISSTGSNLKSISGTTAEIICKLITLWHLLVWSPIKFKLGWAFHRSVQVMYPETCLTRNRTKITN